MIMIKLTGGNGSSKDQAIIILNAKNESEGVDAEYSYIVEHFGEEDIYWKFLYQHFIDGGNKQYDILHVDVVDGAEKEFYFDITDFYAKQRGQSPHKITLEAPSS